MEITDDRIINITKEEIGKLKYEECTQYLDYILEAIDSFDLPLDDVLIFYEKAHMLLNRNNQILKQAEGKIEILKKGLNNDIEIVDYE